MRILVAEDVHRLADDIAEGLRDQGMAVDVAYDGRAARTKLDLHPYDVVVLDRDLPGIHGDTLCRAVVEREERPMILMLTAAGAATERVDGLTLGADDYLPKPFHFPELVLRIRALARRKPSARSHILERGDLRLDPLRRRATEAERPLDLSVKEFAVLEALLSEAPDALSAEALLQRVWDENANPFSNTVQVTISRLRRKLRNSQRIETLPGIGYRIAPEE